MSRTPAQLAASLAELHRPEDQPVRDQLIVGALADQVAAVREVAVAWAARCLEPGTLLSLVSDPANAVVRNAALAALDRQGPYAVAYVEQATLHPDADVAMFACQVLGGISGRSSAGPLLGALSRPEVNVVLAAAEALGRLGCSEAVPALSALLASEPWLQLAAADALGAIGDRRAAPALLAMVPDSFVVEPALDALRRIAAPSALPRLLQLLLDPAHRAIRPSLLKAIAATLEATGPAPQLAPIGQAIESDHSATGVWQFLATRLGGDAEDPELPAPEKATDDRSSHRVGRTSLRAAVQLVLALGITSLLPLAIRWLDDHDTRVWLLPLARHHGLEQAAAAPALLTHPDPAVRSGVLWLLPPAVLGFDRLCAALSDPEPTVQVAACDALGRLAEARAIEPLVGQLASPSGQLRAAAAQALAHLPAEPLADALARFFEPGVREAELFAALTVLAARPCSALTDRVLHLVGSSNPAVRRAAMRAAAQVPGSKVDVLLLRALADREPALQVEALDLLVGRGGDRVVATLRALLAAGDSLRYHVIRALGRLGATEAVTSLQQLFPTAPLHERIEIVTALAHIGGVGARPFLVDCLEQEHPEIRRVAAQGLASVAGPEDVDLLNRLARDGDWVLRSEAAQALGRLGIPSTRAALLDLARDLEPAVARTARAALAVR